MGEFWIHNTLQDGLNKTPANTLQVADVERIVATVTEPWEQGISNGTILGELHAYLGFSIR
jgi:hypothetical protein